MNKLKLRLTKINGYGYAGYIEGTVEVPVEGEYQIEWDDDIPQAIIESCYAVGIDNSMHDLDLRDIDNLDSIEYDISIDGPIMDWQADRIAAMADSFDEDC